MSILGASKAKLNQAITKLGNRKSRLDFQSSGSLQALELRRATIQSYLTQVRAAQRTLTEKRQAFLDVVKNLASEGENSDAQEISAQESRVDGAIATAESIISSLSVRLNEVNTLIDTNQLKYDTNSHPYAIKKINGNTRQRHLLRVTPLVRMHCRSAQSTRPVCRRTTCNTNPVVQPQPLQPTSSAQPAIQHGKLTLEPFTGEAQVVLQDLDPDECNYLELVKALKSRYDRPYKTRATLHKQLQQLPAARNNGQDLR
ncbi:hypothetical protein OSTOST_02808, partial [Ostertagia ostertagi]